MAEFLLDERGIELRVTADRRVIVGRVAVAACAFAGGFILAGFNEQWSLIQLLLLLALAVWFRYEVIWCALMGTIAGFGVVMVAPGNAVRAATLAKLGAHGLPVVEAVSMALYQTALLIGQTLVFRFYAVIPVVVVGYIAGHGQRARKRSLWLLATFAVCFGLIAVSILPVLLITGIMSFRGFTGATFILITACGIMGYLAACRD